MESCYHTRNRQDTGEYEKYYNMALPKEAPSAPIIDTGYYPAVCVGATCMGTITGEFKGQQNSRLLVSWTFELQGQDYEVDGMPRPRLFSITLNHAVTKPSADKQAKIWELRETWLDKPLDLAARKQFDANSVVSEYANLLVIKEFKEGEARNKIDGISSYKGEKFKPQTKSWNFDITTIATLEDAEDAMLAFPEWQQKNIRESLEYQGLKAAAVK